MSLQWETADIAAELFKLPSRFLLGSLDSFLSIHSSRVLEEFEGVYIRIILGKITFLWGPAGGGGICQVDLFPSVYQEIPDSLVKSTYLREAAAAICLVLSLCFGDAWVVQWLSIYLRLRS